jgi:hypothetical protein
MGLRAQIVIGLAEQNPSSKTLSIDTICELTGNQCVRPEGGKAHRSAFSLLLKTGGRERLIAARQGIARRGSGRRDTPRRAWISANVHSTSPARQVK